MRYLFALLLSVSSAQCMTYTYAQTVGNSVASLTVVFSPAPSFGDALVCGIASNVATTPPASWTVIDSASFTTIAYFTSFDHTVVSGEINSYVFTLASTGSGTASCYDVTGAALSPIDQHGVTTFGNANPRVTPSLAPSQLGDLALSFVANLGADTLVSVSAGWTVDTTGGGPYRGWASSKSLSSSAAVSNTFTMNANDIRAASLILISPLVTTLVSGSVLAPDGSSVTGKYVVQLTRSSVKNTCTGSTQTTTFQPVVSTLSTGGWLSLSLYPSPCLSLGTNQTPLLQAGVGAGTTPTVTVTGTQYGTLSITTGTSPALLATVALFIPRVTGLSLATQCFLHPLDAETVAGATVAYSSQRITITSTSALTAGTGLQWSWACVQPYTVTLYDTLNQAVYRGQWLVPITRATDVSTVDITQLSSLLPAGVVLSWTGLTNLQWTSATNAQWRLMTD